MSRTRTPPSVTVGGPVGGQQVKGSCALRATIRALHSSPWAPRPIHRQPIRLDRPRFRRCPLRTDERLPASPFLAQHGSAVVAGTIASTNSPGLSTARPSALRWRRHVQVVKEPRSSALLSPFLVRFARTQKGHLSCSREDWFDWWPCPISSSSTPRAALIGCEVRIPHCATYGKGGQ